MSAPIERMRALQAAARKAGGSFLDRVGARVLIVSTAALAFVIAAATTAYFVVFSGPGTYRITAQFVATPGLYADNAVAILGVPTGHVVSLKPHATYVDVVLAIPKNVKVPANAQAVLMAPNPVSDRFVELTPPFTTGATLAPGAVIPLNRTIVPLELDQVYESVDELSKLLGPEGANQNGELSHVLSAFANLADGNGADLHSAIASIAASLPALTKNPDDLSKLVNGLDSLTRKLAARDETINSLYSNLATVTSQFAEERQTMASAIANLQRGLAQVATFIRKNQVNLTQSVRNLATTVDAVMKEQAALIETFDTAPLGFQNFNRTIQTDADCVSPKGAPHNCTTLWGRLDLTKDFTKYLAQYCGDSIIASFLPIMEWNAGLADATARETGCGALIGLYQNRVGPAGAPNTPDLDLTHYLGTK